MRCEMSSKPDMIINCPGSDSSNEETNLSVEEDNLKEMVSEMTPEIYERVVSHSSQLGEEVNKGFERTKRAEQEADQIRQQLEEYKRLLDVKDKRIDELMKEIENYKQDLRSNSLETRESELLKLCEEKEDKIKALDSHNKQLQCQAQQYEMEMTNLREKYEIAAEKVIEFAGEIKASDGKLRKHEATIAKLHTDCDLEREKRMKLELKRPSEKSLKMVKRAVKFAEYFVLARFPALPKIKSFIKLRKSFKSLSGGSTDTLPDGFENKIRDLLGEDIIKVEDLHDTSFESTDQCGQERNSFPCVSESVVHQKPVSSKQRKHPLSKMADEFSKFPKNTSRFQKVLQNRKIGVAGMEPLRPQDFPARKRKYPDSHLESDDQNDGGDERNGGKGSVNHKVEGIFEFGRKLSAQKISPLRVNYAPETGKETKRAKRNRPIVEEFDVTCRKSVRPSKLVFAASSINSSGRDTEKKMNIEGCSQQPEAEITCLSSESVEPKVCSKEIDRSPSDGGCPIESNETAVEPGVEPNDSLGSLKLTLSEETTIGIEKVISTGNQESEKSMEVEEPKVIGVIQDAQLFVSGHSSVSLESTELKVSSLKDVHPSSSNGGCPIESNEGATEPGVDLDDSSDNLKIVVSDETTTEGNSICTGGTEQIPTGNREPEKVEQPKAVTAVVQDAGSHISAWSESTTEPKVSSPNDICPSPDGGCLIESNEVKLKDSLASWNLVVSEEAEKMERNNKAERVVSTSSMARTRQGEVRLSKLKTKPVDMFKPSSGQTTPKRAGSAKNFVNTILDNVVKKSMSCVQEAEKLYAEFKLKTVKEMAEFVVVFITKEMRGVDMSSCFLPSRRSEIVSMEEKRLFNFVGEISGKENWEEIWFHIIHPLAFEILKLSRAGTERSRFCTWVRIFSRACSVAEQIWLFNEMMKSVIRRSDRQTVIEAIQFMALSWPTVFRDCWLDERFLLYRMIFSLMVSRCDNKEKVRRSLMEKSQVEILDCDQDKTLRELMGRARIVISSPFTVEWGINDKTPSVSLSAEFADLLVLATLAFEHAEKSVKDPYFTIVANDVSVIFSNWQSRSVSMETVLEAIPSVLVFCRLLIQYGRENDLLSGAEYFKNFAKNLNFGIKEAPVDLESGSLVGLKICYSLMDCIFKLSAFGSKRLKQNLEDLEKSLSGLKADLFRKMKDEFEKRC